MVSRKVMEKEIEIIKILPPEIIKPNIYIKNKTLDVLINVDKQIVCIELNSEYYSGLRERNASYAFSKYSEESKVGESYTDMRPIIQYNFTKDLPNIYPKHACYTLTDKNTGLSFVKNT